MLLTETQSPQDLAEKTVCVLLVRGENPDGGDIYAYVAVRSDRLEAFMEAQKNDLFYPEDYGVIIESGEGEPSAEVRKRMEEEYGFDHEYMVDIPDSSAAQQIKNTIEAAAEEEARGAGAAADSADDSS